MAACRKWGAIFIAACCLLAGGTHMSWARETPAQGNGAAHITVNDTVYGVLHNHRSLMSIKENREVLEHELSKARAGFGPRVDVAGEIGVGVLSDTTSRGLDLDDQWLSVGSVSAKLVQPIWDGFATRSRVRTAQATLDSVKARVFDTATSLSLDGIIAHIDLLRRIKLVELARNNVARHETILAQARDRASMGADTQADVTQAESRLQRAHSSLSEAEDALRVAYATYSRLTGIYTVGRLDVVPMPAQMPDTAAAFIQMAEKHNPKLAAYLQDIRAAKGEKELAQSAMYPTFQLEAGPEYSDRGGDRKGSFVCRETDQGKHGARRWRPGDCVLPMSISCRLCCAAFLLCAASAARHCPPSSCWPGFRAAPSRPRHACGWPARRG